MRRLAFLLALIVSVTTVACETEQVDTETAEADLQTEVQAVSSEIDTHLNRVDEKVTTIETAVMEMDEGAQEEINEILQKVQEERQDVADIEAELNAATDLDEVRRLRLKMWEEHSDIDALLTEARVEASENLEGYTEVVTTEIEDYDRTLQQMESAAQEAGTDMQQEYQDVIDETRSERQALQENMQDLENVTSENWEETRTEFVEGWRDFSTGVARTLEPGDQGTN